MSVEPVISTFSSQFTTIDPVFLASTAAYSQANNNLSPSPLVSTTTAGVTPWNPFYSQSNNYLPLPTPMATTVTEPTSAAAAAAAAAATTVTVATAAWNPATSSSTNFIPADPAIFDPFIAHHITKPSLQVASPAEEMGNVETRLHRIETFLDQLMYKLQ
jgi:hypothetical protein